VWLFVFVASACNHLEWWTDTGGNFGSDDVMCEGGVMRALTTMLMSVKSL